MNYNDIYIHDNFDDSGIIPSSDCAYESPDIIPCQGNVLSYSKAQNDYGGQDIGLPIMQDGINNIYVRAFNLGDPDTGSVRLFYTKASLLMAPNSAEWKSISDASGLAQVQFVDDTGQHATTQPESIILALEKMNKIGQQNNDFTVLQLQGTATNQHTGEIVAALIASLSNAHQPLLSTKAYFDSNTYPWVLNNVTKKLGNNKLLVLLNDFVDNALACVASELTLNRATALAEQHNSKYAEFISEQ